MSNRKYNSVAEMLMHGALVDVAGDDRFTCQCNDADENCTKCHVEFVLKTVERIWDGSERQQVSN